MHKQKGEQEILLALAERLPEKVLLELLPQIEPETVRQLLIRLAGGSPPPEQSQQNPLFSNSPSSRAYTLYTDGAARGNPGEAGAGAVLVKPDGVEFKARSLYLGQCTNNVAEYNALIAGLELAEQSGCRELFICLDSELIIRQIQGTYKVKNEQLKPLFEQVKSHLQKLEKWDVRHIPREENTRADELANKGIDDKVQEIGAGA